MKHISWRDRAIQVIADGLLEYEAAQACSSEPINPEKCRRWLNESRYPFGVRAYSPYTVWLDETRKTLAFWETSQPARLYPTWRSQQRYARAEVSHPDQLTFFGD